MKLWIKSSLVLLFEPKAFSLLSFRWRFQSLGFVYDHELTGVFWPMFAVNCVVTPVILDVVFIFIFCASFRKSYQNLHLSMRFYL